MAKPLTINIQPPVSVYATYRRLSYKPWYAIAEFLDNSTHSYYSHKNELKEVYAAEGGKKLIVRVHYDSEKNQLQIIDNANGMDFSELQRAIVLNCPPSDTSGRCEFGMGLKTAACWFGRKWSIETTRLGSRDKYNVTLDIEEMSKQSKENVLVKVSKEDPSKHGTIITIDGLYKPIQGRTSARIKDQLSSIYRIDLLWGEVEIWWNGDKLSFPNPPILEEKAQNGDKKLWRKAIKLDVPWHVENQVLKAKGWIGIRIPGSQRDAGLVLLRRGRVIVGGPDNGYKPEQIFGQGNTFRSQRLIGELHMDDWPVTQAKDAFDWSGGLEDEFVKVLKEHCKEFMEKAEEHRVDRKQIGQTSSIQLDQPSQIDSQSAAVEGVQDASISPPRGLSPTSSMEVSEPVPITKLPKRFTLKLHNENWVFKIYWQDSESDTHWMSVEYPSDKQIDIYLNSSHPFFAPYLVNPYSLKMLQKIIVALAFAERLARSSQKEDLVHAADFRNYMNHVLRYADYIVEEEDDVDDRS
jgi:hypothetical protein